jgi:hypothetical protein
VNVRDEKEYCRSRDDAKWVVNRLEAAKVLSSGRANAHREEALKHQPHAVSNLVMGGNRGTKRKGNEETEGKTKKRQT